MKQNGRAAPIVAWTDEHAPVHDRIREYYPNAYMQYPKKVKFAVECQTEQSMAQPPLRDAAAERDGDISRYLSKPLQYHKHNVANLEDSGLDPALNDDVKDVQRYINQYRNQMLGAIQDHNEGADPMSLKEIEARVKWRKMVNGDS